MKQFVKLFRVDIPANRIFGLDMLRAGAIFFVLFGHSISLLPSTVSGPLSFLSLDGVSIFFVLSGYLIGGILIADLNRHGPSPKTLVNFWKRRWWRTLPAYYFDLILFFVVQCFLKGQISRSTILPYLFFGQNIASPIRKNFFLESWSLSVEEWFYVSIPLTLVGFILLARISVKKSVIITAVLFIILSTSFRWFRYSQHQPNSYYEWEIVYRKQVVTRLDSIAYGVVAAYIANYYPYYWMRYKTTLLIIGCIGLFAVQAFTVIYFEPHINLFNLFSCVFLFSISALSAFCLLPYLNQWKTNHSWLGRQVVVTSLISYSLYLLNLFVLIDVIYPIPTPGSGFNFYAVTTLKFVLFWVLSYLLAVLQVKFVELPTTKLRDTANWRELFRVNR